MPAYGQLRKPQMRDIALVTDGDLARARVDPGFRHRLVVDNLELLLSELNRLRSRKAGAIGDKHLREGVDLAVRLADLLHRIERPAAGRDSDQGSLTAEMAAGKVPYERAENQ